MNTNDDFWYDENCPCNGCPSEAACGNAPLPAGLVGELRIPNAACTVKKQACEDFLHYASTGVKRHRDRHPSFALYHKLFPGILSEEGDPEDAE